MGDFSAPKLTYLHPLGGTGWLSLPTLWLVLSIYHGF